MSDAETIARWMHEIHRRVNGNTLDCMTVKGWDYIDMDDEVQEHREKMKRLYIRVAEAMLADPHPLLSMPKPEIVEAKR